ncbi:hypothetical protein EYF80_016739 [Liparis tanakae]|uniref:Uncharacterized protein n=1 Tax=Liparis tanakae TaxID=230148 RepID=A0A4Z2I4T1_9TELE|nr:hypothetical protein EYF80_016739 [Liparis tanakae]
MAYYTTKDKHPPEQAKLLFALADERRLTVTVKSALMAAQYLDPTMLCKICTRSHTAASCDSTKHHSVCTRSNTSNPPAVKSVTRPSSAAAD